MPKKVLTLALTALWACPCGAQADEPAKSPDAATAGSAQLMQLCKIDIKGDKKDQWMRLPKAEASVTQHRIIAAGGKPIDYTATAGTMIIRDDEDKPIASIGYVAYTRRDAKAGSRPSPSPSMAARLFLAVAAHGRARTPARGGRRSAADTGRALSHGRQ